MRKILMLLLGLLLHNLCYCQLDCKMAFENYSKTIDTTKRPVYSVVESMPDIIVGSKLIEFFSKNVQLTEKFKCFPFYIHYGFVVEVDGSITNVMFCPTLRFCDENEDIGSIEQKYIQQLSAEIVKIKSTAGILNGKKVAVYTIGRVHFDPQ